MSSSSPLSVSSPLSTPFIHSLPNDLILHLAQLFLDDRDAVRLVRTSPHLCAQLNGSTGGGSVSRYLIKGESKYYFVFQPLNAALNTNASTLTPEEATKSQFRVRYVTNCDPTQAGLKLESSIVAELVEKKETGKSLEKKHNDEESKAKDADPSTSFGWIVRPSKWRLGTPSKLTLCLSIYSWPITVEYVSNEYRVFDAAIGASGSNPSATSAPAAGTEEGVAQEQQAPTSDMSNEWQRVFYDSAFFPSSLESLLIINRLCTDPIVPRLTHCRRLHTLTYHATYHHHLKIDPAEVYPPSLRRIIYETNYDTIEVPSFNVSNVRFPSTVTEMDLRCGFTSPEYLANPNLIPFPSTLEILRTDFFTTHQLAKWTVFPPSLRALHLGDFFRGELDGWCAPKSLESLTFGYRWDQSLDHVTLPEGLLEVHFGSYFNQSLAHARFPKSLKIFTIGDAEDSRHHFSEELPDLSHTQIEVLVLPPEWDRSLDELRLPQATMRKLVFRTFNQPISESFLRWIESAQQLTHLDFGKDFDQPIDGLLQALSRSNTFTHLAFGMNFNQPFSASIPLPPNLKHLEFGHMFTQTLRAITLPKCLEVLKLGNYFGVNAAADGASITTLLPDLSHTKLLEFRISENLHIDELKFPPTLKTLILDGKFNRSVKSLLLPPCLTSLQFGLEFSAWSEKLRLPDSLEKFWIGNSKVIAPMGDVSHTKLKLLTFPPKWNASLSQLKLPPTLEALTFGRDFNKSLSELVLPNALRHLTFDLKFNDAKFSTVLLPPALRQLRFSQDERASYIHALPSLAHLKYLHTLTLSGKWNRPAEELKFYLGPFDEDVESTPSQGLRHLHFGDEWNQPVDNLLLPTTLLELQFGSKFVHPLDRLVLPPQLTALHFGASWNQSLEPVLLPPSIRSLWFGREFNQSLLLRLPYLEYLHFDAALKTSKFDRIESVMEMPISKSLRQINKDINRFFRQ